MDTTLLLQATVWTLSQGTHVLGVLWKVVMRMTPGMKPFLC